MIRLIASDLDGTLLDLPDSISQVNIDAIEYAYQKGVQFCFASGRNLSSVLHLSDLLKHPPIYLLSNGAEMYDEKRNLLFQNLLDTDCLKDVCEILDQEQVNFFMYTTDGIFTRKEPSYVRERIIECLVAMMGEGIRKVVENSKNKPCNNLIKIDDFDEFIATQKILKIEGFDLSIEAIYSAKEKLKCFGKVSYLSTGRNNIEITSSTTSKGYALKKYCQMMGIQEDEVLVLGDSENDMSLFEDFKYSFAPSNALEIIKEKAYQVSTSCQEHAVASVIYQMIK